MNGLQSSFYSFLMEPMVDLEPGVVEGPDSLASFNNELEQSIGMVLGSAYVNTQDPKETASKDKNELKKSNQGRPIKQTAVRRTKISLYQKLQLEYAFQQNPYPSQAVRAQLAYNLGLGNKTLVNWFKKRRYRWRRQHLNPGEPAPFEQACFIPEPQVLGQHFTPQDTCTCCFQEESASAFRRQESQQFPF